MKSSGPFQSVIVILCGYQSVQPLQLKLNPYSLHMLHMVVQLHSLLPSHPGCHHVCAMSPAKPSTFRENSHLGKSKNPFHLLTWMGEDPDLWGQASWSTILFKSRVDLATFTIQQEELATYCKHEFREVQGCHIQGAERQRREVQCKTQCCIVMARDKETCPPHSHPNDINQCHPHMSFSTKPQFMKL